MNRRKYVAIALVISSLTAIYYLSQIIGYNVTNSLNFRFYYHTVWNPKDSKKGDYVLFDLPKNELYADSLQVVKKISCFSGDYLETKEFQDTVNYYCNSALISTAEIFTDTYGSPIQHFEYDGFIPDGYVFVTGDSTNSFDSRYWGFLSYERIKRSVHPIKFFSNAAYAAEYVEEINTGFYKYNTPTITSEEEEHEEDLSSPTVTVLEKPVIPWDQVSVMPPKEFAKLYEQVQDYAMTYRTLENYDSYAKLRQVMISRSVEFMNIGTLWGQLNPSATDEDWFPVSGFGQSEYKAQAAAIRTQYIQENKDDFALLYFYRLDCGFCLRQKPIMDYFEDVSGWDVKAVDTSQFPEAVSRFNIKSVPSIILVERVSERWMPIASGLMTYEEIEERLYRTLKYLKGETDEKDFSNPVRPDNYVFNTDTSITGSMDR